MTGSERDPRLDAAWRAASGEQPPAALDATIRAAARRAIDASPVRRRGQWSYPLAAAATVAVLAVAIARLTPPEQVAPTTVTSTAPVQREAPNAAEPQSAASAPPGLPLPTPSSPGPMLQSPALKAASAGNPPRINGQKTAPNRPRGAGGSPGDPRADATEATAANFTSPPLAVPARSEPFPASRGGASRAEAGPVDSVDTDAQPPQYSG